jgi:DNA polymerase-1
MRPGYDSKFFRFLNSSESNKISDVDLTLNIQVGDDSRSRCMSSPFGTKTSRNTPSSTKFIFGCHPGFRGLIKPEPGMALAYLDYAQQEIMVAAALSGDANLLHTYQSGDPYIALAKLAKAVPPDATKTSHPDERTLYKRCSLAVQYGMGSYMLAAQTGIGEPYARELIVHHKRAFPKYWAFTQRIQDHGMLGQPLTTAFGWRICARHPVKPTTFCNWPIQATGAEILRLALILMVEDGIAVAATVHDAVLIEAPIGEIDETATRAKAIMEKASEILLGSYTVQVDSEIIRYPDRFKDEKGAALWRLIEEYFGEVHTPAKLADPGGAT